MSVDRAPQAAEIAAAMSEGMNHLFLFAAPRVLAQVHAEGLGERERAAMLGSLHFFLRNANGIRARARELTGDVGRLVAAADLVERIAIAMPSAPLGEPLPASIVDLARRALDALGFAEPRGGWDGFEGFQVGPAPSKEA